MTLPKEVILEALRCCRDVYPHSQDFLVSSKVDGHTILAVEGTNETTDWVTQKLILGNIKHQVACIFTKRRHVNKIKFYGTVVPEDKWIVFPWE